MPCSLDTSMIVSNDDETKDKNNNRSPSLLTLGCDYPASLESLRQLRPSSSSSSSPSSLSSSPSTMITSPTPTTDPVPGTISNPSSQSRSSSKQHSFSIDSLVGRDHHKKSSPEDVNVPETSQLIELKRIQAYYERLYLHNSMFQSDATCSFPPAHPPAPPPSLPYSYLKHPSEPKTLSQHEQMLAYYASLYFNASNYHDRQLEDKQKAPEKSETFGLHPSSRDNQDSMQDDGKNYRESGGLLYNFHNSEQKQCNELNSNGSRSKVFPPSALFTHQLAGHGFYSPYCDYKSLSNKNFSSENEEELPSRGNAHTTSPETAVPRALHSPHLDPKSDDSNVSGSLSAVAAAYHLSNMFRKPKRIRTAFSPGQLLRLEEIFERNRYVVGCERKQLARDLNLSETQIKVWFQNRRTKHKREKYTGGHAEHHQRSSSSSSSPSSLHRTHYPDEKKYLQTLMSNSNARSSLSRPSLSSSSSSSFSFAPNSHLDPGHHRIIA